MKWADRQSQIKFYLIRENAGLAMFSRTSSILSSYDLSMTIIVKPTLNDITGKDQTCLNS